MEYSRILCRALALIGDGRPAVLSTVGADGYPRSRWVVPAVLPRIKGAIYCLTARGFGKVTEIEAESRVHWLLQSADFTEVVELSGTAGIVDDPSFSAELVKSIGPHLEAFWRISGEASALVAVETRIDLASLLYPMRGERYSAARPSPGEACHE